MNRFARACIYALAYAVSIGSIVGFMWLWDRGTAILGLPEDVAYIHPVILAFVVVPYGLLAIGLGALILELSGVDPSPKRTTTDSEEAK